MAVIMYQSTWVCTTPRERLNAGGLAECRLSKRSSGWCRVGLHVGFVFRKPFKIPPIRHGADLLKQVVVAILASAWPVAPTWQWQPLGHWAEAKRWWGICWLSFSACRLGWLCCWGLPWYQLQMALARSLLNRLKLWEQSPGYSVIYKQL